MGSPCWQGSTTRIISELLELLMRYSDCATCYPGGRPWFDGW
ncbi:hypothetical protein C5167_049674 [Papaver somniferum]|uniref:Uncharacterized protein n=1 Tax=Papaver somniferum TaxID=3469 RepID=A0A4Y7KP72_PAPSO|nr:hypothetical protein C5167_049674 [Papaver somniferum]